VGSPSSATLGMASEMACRSARAIASHGLTEAVPALCRRTRKGLGTVDQIARESLKNEKASVDQIAREIRVLHP